MPEPETCAVLVPVTRYLEPACDDALRALERQGYHVVRLRYPALDQARNRLATTALRGGFEKLMFIDPDIEFAPNTVDKLCEHKLPLVTGAYLHRHPKQWSIEPLPECRTLKMGPDGGLVQIRRARCGFLLAQRQVFDDVRHESKLVEANQRFGQSILPFFLPMIAQEGDRFRYLGADWSFVERATGAGHRLFVDTTIRLSRIGGYCFDWADLAGPPRDTPDAVLEL